MIEYMEPRYEKKGEKLTFEPCENQLIRNIEKNNKKLQHKHKRWDETRM